MDEESSCCSHAHQGARAHFHLLNFYIVKDEAERK